MLSRFLIPLALAIMAAGCWKAYSGINPSEDWGAAAALFMAAVTLSGVALLMLVLFLLPVGRQIFAGERKGSNVAHLRQ